MKISVSMLLGLTAAPTIKYDNLLIDALDQKKNNWAASVVHLANQIDQIALRTTDLSRYYPYERKPSWHSAVNVRTP